MFLTNLVTVETSNTFGDKYTSRNVDRSSNLHNVIGKDLYRKKIKISSALEIGCNIGLNLHTLQKIFPKARLYGVEINKSAYQIANKNFQCFNKSIYNFNSKKKFDIVISSGVLIHQNPKYLEKFYRKMYSLSKKYLYLDEYFNPDPVRINYRGFKNKLFKRDFAKELWKLYPKLKLIDYGFHWAEDPAKKNSCDNSNWFLFKK